MNTVVSGVPGGRAPRVGSQWPKAVLWDMDGTLVDTEDYWIDVEYALAEKYGGTWNNELAMQLVGNDLIDSGRFLAAHFGVDVAPEVIVEELLDGVVGRVRDEVPWRPGARELLAALVDQGVPCALVTMSYQRFVDPILALLPAGSFTTVVTGDNVSHGKPHPAPYLKAAATLGLEPGDCLAIEDSNTGATSAEAAGCPVLVVPHLVTVAPGPGRIFADSLAGVGVDDLRRLATAR